MKEEEAHRRTKRGSYLIIYSAPFHHQRQGIRKLTFENCGMVVLTRLIGSASVSTAQILLSSLFKRIQAELYLVCDKDLSLNSEESSRKYARERGWSPASKRMKPGRGRSRDIPVVPHSSEILMRREANTIVALASCLSVDMDSGLRQTRTFGEHFWSLWARSGGQGGKTQVVHSR